MAALLMLGAIESHLTRLGIVVRDDGGPLFGLALTVFASSLGFLWLHRAELARRRRTRNGPGRSPGRPSVIA